MSKDNDGGPAFPPQVIRDGDGLLQEVTVYGVRTGMSLRDYFAAKLAAAFCAGPGGGVDGIAGVDADWKHATARTAYELADAMLAVRAK